MLDRAPDGKEKLNGAEMQAVLSSMSPAKATALPPTTPDASSSERKLFKAEISKQMASLDEKDRAKSVDVV
jgi:hypothetical protein